MSEFRLYSPEMLHFLWLAPAVALLLWFSLVQRRKALARLAGERTLHRIAGARRSGRALVKGALVTAAVALAACALARPAWDRKEEEVKRRGRDVAFIVDVSRSMLANDLRPNRLERAKLAVLDAVEELNGDRVALVAFAGSASVKCPLTLDYGFFRMAVEDLSPDSAPLGGTRIGNAIRRTLDEVFTDERSLYRDIVLITDGEDHDSGPVEAARAAADRGVRLIAIGLGDESSGARIPVDGPPGPVRFLEYDGREVLSRLDAVTLRRMTAATPGGQYFNVSTGAIDLGEVYRQLIATAPGREFESETVERYQEKFQIFLGLAFFLLLGEMLIRERGGSPR